MKLFLLVSCLFCLINPLHGLCDDEVLRYGVSKKMLSGFNENDALASIKIWTESLAFHQVEGITPIPHLYEGEKRIGESLKNSEDDCYYITTKEYFSFFMSFDTKRFIVPVKKNSPYESFLLLVNKNARVGSINELAHSSILILNNSRTDIGKIWFQTYLYENQLGSVETFFGEIEQVEKLNEAILPVFFQKKGACLVTKEGFMTMVELNPQLAKQLVILAESPPYVPAGLFFRKGYVSSAKERLYNDVEKWVKDPSYKQLAIIFQMDGLKPASSEILDDTLSLLKRSYEITSQKKNN